MKVIAITNQKGGVGKTTSSINISAGLGIKGKKILLIDLDPQANATTGLGVEKNDIENDIYDILVDGIDPNSAILQTNAPNVWIIPSSMNLAGADIQLSNLGKDNGNILKNRLAKLEKKFDYVIIDCPPSLGLLNKNALIYADSVIIPIQTEYFALEGLTQLLSTISTIKKLFNSKLQIEGILLTMFISNANLAQEIQEEVKKFFKERVYKTVINRNIKLAEAPSMGKSIFQYDKSSQGAKSYMELVEEILKSNK